MTSSNKITANVEELHTQDCPANALIWEFLQNKDLEVSELATRINIMFERQHRK
jgi:hypothetical protein